MEHITNLSHSSKFCSTLPEMEPVPFLRKHFGVSLTEKVASCEEEFALVSFHRITEC